MENQVWGIGNCYLCIFCCACVFACICVRMWACVHACVSVHVRACMYRELACAQLCGWALHIDAFPFSLLPICKICQTKTRKTLIHVFTWIEEWYNIETKSPIWKTRTREIGWKKEFFLFFLSNLYSKLFILFNKIWNNALNSGLRVKQYSNIGTQNRDFAYVAWLCSTRNF